MGFFDSLEGADLIANAEDVGFRNPDPGVYSFEVVGGELKVGTKKSATDMGFIVKYQLEDKDGKTQNYGEYLGVPTPADPRNPTEDDRRKASYLKARLLSLGIPENKVTTVEPDDMVGITGSLRLVENKGYLSVRDLKVKAATPQPKAATVRKAPPQRTAAPIASAPEPETSDEATPTAPAQKAMPPKVAGNPFA